MNIAFILAAITLGAAPSTTWVEQREGQCILRDFDDRLDGSQNGAKLWFGRAIELRCSFYASLHFVTGGRNAISASGMIDNPHDRTMYHGYSVAFLDSEENLIACEGGEVGGSSARESVTRLMPVPKGMHSRVASYKVAYYESNRPIEKTQPQRNVHVTSTTNGVTEERDWPAWKSDGELRGTPFRIRDGSRPLPNGADNAWRAETNEGQCSLNQIAISDLEALEKRGFAVVLGKNLKLKANCRFDVNRDNAIEVWVNFASTFDKEMHGELYAAFFDKYGNLVGATHAVSKMGPNGYLPSGTVTSPDGKTQTIISGFQCALPVPIPLGFDQHIASYKATLYVSETSIGQRKSTAAEPTNRKRQASS